MNQDQFMGVVRALIALGSGYLVGHGYQSQGDAELLTGVVLAIAPLVWTMIAHRDAGLVASVMALPDESKVVVAASIPDAAKISLAAAVPDVAQIVTTPAKADADPSPKVVSVPR